MGWPRMSRSALVSQSSGRPRRSTMSSSDTNRTRSTSGSPTAVATRPCRHGASPAVGRSTTSKWKTWSITWRPFRSPRTRTWPTSSPGSALPSTDWPRPMPRSSSPSSTKSRLWLRSSRRRRMSTWWIHWQRRRERPSTEPPPASTPMPTESPMRPRRSSVRSPPRRSRRSRSWSRSLSTRRQPTPSSLTMP